MPRTKPRVPLRFLIDNREQREFAFSANLLRANVFEFAGIEHVTLQEGDYSVSIGEDLSPLNIRLERKELGDLFNCCGYERDRFTRELIRLQPYEYKALLIEASLSQILQGYERSRIPGRTVAASVITWGVRYKLHCFFAESHRRAAGVAQRILETYAKDWLDRLANGSKGG